MVRAEDGEGVYSHNAVRLVVGETDHLRQPVQKYKFIVATINNLLITDLGNQKLLMIAKPFNWNLYVCMEGDINR